MNLYRYSFVLLLGLMSTLLSGQTFNAFMKAAEEAVINENFYAAQSYFGEALQFDTSDVDVRYAYAKSLKDFHAYTTAEDQYIKLLELDSTYSFPTATYELAQVQQQLGKYTEAKRNYELFLSEYTGDDEQLLKKTTNEIEALMWAIEEDGKSVVAADVEKLSGDINTSYSEFGATPHADSFYYSSLRFESLSDEFDPKRTFAKILSSMDDETGGTVVENGNINDTPLHVAHTAFSPDGDKLFYTVCEYQNAYDIRCDLYYRDIDDAGNFGEENKLPDFINGVEHTSTQPHVVGGENGALIIYYSTDRPSPTLEDTGLDIWMFTMTSDDQFTSPTRLDKINTLGDEITPFFHKSTSTLYWSSDSGFRFGGYDVFKAVKTAEGYQDRMNLGMDVNSSYNDVYYRLSDDGSKAYFSSNRLGSNYLDGQAEACCYDIYKAELEESIIKLNALTFLRQNMSELDGVTVELIDALTGELLDVVTQLDSHEHIFEVERGREYMLVASKSGFISDTLQINTFDVTDTMLTRKMFLESNCVQLDLKTFNQLTNQSLNGVEITIEDLSTPGAPPMKKLEMNGNTYLICLEPDKEYKITATKPGFEPTSLMINTGGVDTGKTIEKKVYLTETVKDLNKLLPVMLYFDNDEPDQDSYKMYTLKNYTDTYYPYIERKEVFKQEYTSTLSGESEKALAAANIESFFEGDVKGGYTELQTFLQTVTTRLQAGQTFELQISGYASPRASEGYNMTLSQRRVFSVKNELRDYNGGILVPYLDNGQLKVRDISYGEQQAPTSVNDEIWNERESIYSVEASRERKAMIVELINLN